MNFEYTENLMGRVTIVCGDFADGSALMSEYRGLAEEYTGAVKGLFGERLVSICFFGPIVTRKATPESDVDVLIIAEKFARDIGSRIDETLPIHEKLRRSEAYRKLRSQGRSAFISEILLTPDEVKTHPPILLDMTEAVDIAYDRGGFLGSVLEDVRRRLKQLGATKVTARRGYYWILKPDARPGEVVEI